ncbi:MAG: hypothetical protein O9327_15000 [Polaromonas sp.]|nr:hypothetical protein [Polaromonas sp.]
MSSQRIQLVSHVVDASIDVRRLCNVVKRLTCVSCLSVKHGFSQGAIVDAINEITVKALVKIGFDVDDERRLERVLPIFLEASGVLLEAALRHESHSDAAVVDDRIVSAAIESLASIAKSRTVVKAIEQPYGFTGDDAIDLRITAAAASASLATVFAREPSRFPLTKMVHAATAFVVEQAIAAAKAETPEHASPAAQRMLAQSFLTNSAKLYAACWEGRGPESDAGEGVTLEAYLAPVHQQFQAAFLASRASSISRLIEFDAAGFRDVYASIAAMVATAEAEITQPEASVQVPAAVSVDASPGMSAIAKARARVRHA